MAATGRRPRNAEKAPLPPPRPRGTGLAKPEVAQGDTASHHEAAASDKSLHQGGGGRSTGGAVGEQGLTSDEGGAGILQTALHTHQAPTVHRGTVRSTAGGIESLSVVW